MPYVNDESEVEIVEVIHEIRRRGKEMLQADDRLRGILSGGTPAPGAAEQLARVDRGELAPFETATPEAQRSQARGGIAPSVRRVVFDEARRPIAPGVLGDIQDEVTRYTEAARRRQEGLAPPSTITPEQRAAYEARRAIRAEDRAAAAPDRGQQVTEEPAARVTPDEILDTFRGGETNGEQFAPNPAEVARNREDEQRRRFGLPVTVEERRARVEKTRRRRGLPPLRHRSESREDYAKRISGLDEPPQQEELERYPDYLKRLDRMGQAGRAADEAERIRDAEDPNRLLMEARVEAGHFSPEIGELLLPAVKGLSPEKASVIFNRYEEDVDAGDDPIELARRNILTSRISVLKNRFRELDDSIIEGQAQPFVEGLMGMSPEQHADLVRRQEITQRAIERDYRKMSIIRRLRDPASIDDLPDRATIALEIAAEELRDERSQGEPKPTDEEVRQRASRIAQELGWETEPIEETDQPAPTPNHLGPGFRFAFDAAGVTVIDPNGNEYPAREIDGLHYPAPQSTSEAAQLPPDTPFVDPDGTLRQVPG